MYCVRDYARLNSVQKQSEIIKIARENTPCIVKQFKLEKSK